MTKKLSYILLLLLIPSMSISQGVKGNAANIGDLRGLFISSAVTAFHHTAQMVAGYELYYSGLGGNGLQNGFAGFSYPHRRVGAFSLVGQYFATEIYRSSNLSFGYGHSWWNKRISLGLDMGMIFISYNQDNFRLVDLNDPVFQNGNTKNALDLGLSVLTNPVDPLYIGISVKHLNQPNISLVGDDVRMPINVQGSVMFNNSFASPLISLEYVDDNFNIDLGLERWFLGRRVMIRANYYQYNLGASAAFILPVQDIRVRLEYEYRYPLSELSDVSSASHLFMLSYAFSKQSPDFEVVVLTSRQSIYQGESAKFIITIDRIGGFDDPVEFSISDPDSNIDSSIIPEKMTGFKTAVLTLTPLDKCLPGDYQFNITARARGRQKEIPVRFKLKKLPALYADVQASVNRLIIKQTTRIRSRDPLLPYIFFAENQSKLNEDRYEILNPQKRPLKDFVFFPERLLDISSKYKNTLNVIAKRLWDHPEMEIMIRGYVSNWGVETDNRELAGRRAETVRDYFIQNCGVRPHQVKVEAHLMPPDPASNVDPRGREENQRVEITCPVESQPILDPIVTETSDIATSDSVCHFQINNFIAEAGLINWKLSIVEEPGALFKVFEKKELPTEDIAWDWKNEAGQSVSVGKDYRYQLSLWDEFGQNHTTEPKTIHVASISEIAREYIQKNIEKSRLILFKYDRADMDLTSTSLREELELNIRKLRKNPDATLLIQGHTDIIGDPDYNRQLSFRRAESVAKYFIDRGISKSRITYEGFGMNRSLMSNALPEGRMMNRRVEIYILYLIK